MTHPSHSQTIRLPRVADKVMKIDIAKSTILILLVAISATGFSAAKKSYKTMTTDELQKEVKRQQLIREINQGCSDPSKLIGGAQARAQWLADREKARREEWHKQNMKARENRLRSNINYRNQQPRHQIESYPVASDSNQTENSDDEYIEAAGTDLERSWREGEVSIRQMAEDRRRAMSQAEKNNLRKMIYRAFDNQKEIENEARERGEDWAR